MPLLFAYGINRFSCDVAQLQHSVASFIVQRADPNGRHILVKLKKF